jgi:hypothetical protein
MNKPTLLFLLSAGLLSGCRTSSPHEKAQLSLAAGSLYGATFAPIADMFMLKNGSLDLLYITASFRNRNGRWPTDYTELTNFVHSSGGYLWLGVYETVEFRSLTNDCLEVSYRRPGQQKEMKVTFGDSFHVK